MRNILEHNFNTGACYRDLEGELLADSEGDRMADADREFSASKLWRILEEEVVALAKELDAAVEVVGHEAARMPIVLGWKVEVEDMSYSEDPAEWSQGNDVFVCEGAGVVEEGWEGVSWGEVVDNDEEIAVDCWDLVVGDVDEGYNSC